MLSVVLPVYNERENLEQLHTELVDALDGLEEEYEIIYVDDGSTDSGFSVLKNIAEEESDVHLLRLKRNFGQSAALQAGFDHASGERIVTLDADLQNDPSDIPTMLQKLDEGYDCVSGWRYPRNDPLSKRFFSWFASLLQRPLMDAGVHDYGSTLKAYRSEAAKDLNLSGELHRYIPPLLVWKGYAVTELKVNHRPRQHGRSKYGSARLLKGFLDMIGVWFWQKFSRRPLHALGGAGVLLFATGLLSAVISAYLWLSGITGLSQQVLPIISIFLILTGLQLFASGVIADIVLKTYYRETEQRPYRVENTV